MKIRIHDLQLARYFILNEIDLDNHLAQNVLSKTVEISSIGEPNTIIARDDGILYQQPSSITHFLFYTLYYVLSQCITSKVQKDKLSIGLVHITKEYVYHDFEPVEFVGPPVLIDLDKLAVPSLIIHEILEPLIGRIETRPILFARSNYLDAAKIVKGDEDLDGYNLGQEISRHDYPFIFVNASLYNDAAKLADITVKTIELSIGKKKCRGFLRNLLLDPHSSLMGNMILVLRTIRGEPDFILDFLKYLESNLGLTRDEESQAAEIQFSFVQSDNYLKEHIKLAYANPSPQIFKQWAQWSMLVGLIEKQLEPMRGSMWPATENLKPIDDKWKRMLANKAKEKNKNQLNFEELLEVARDVYNHKAVEPGMLYEIMLKDNRVWKT